jgi:hypothetical protein
MFPIKNCGFPDSSCCGYEELDPTTAATDRGLVERELSINKLIRFSSDLHWIGGGFLLQRLLLMRSLHLTT